MENTINELKNAVELMLEKQLERSNLIEAKNELIMQEGNRNFNEIQSKLDEYLQCIISIRSLDEIRKDLEKDHISVYDEDFELGIRLELSGNDKGLIFLAKNDLFHLYIEPCRKWDGSSYSLSCKQFTDHFKTFENQKLILYRLFEDLIKKIIELYIDKIQKINQSITNINDTILALTVNKNPNDELKTNPDDLIINVNNYKIHVTKNQNNE